MSIWRRSSIPRSSGKNNAPRSAARLFAVLFCALAVGLFAALMLGSTETDVFAAIGAWLRGDMNDPDLRILIYVRMPRVLAALLAGSALAVAGVIIQAVLNNPMAAPNIIGVNSGAGLCAVIFMAILPQALPFLPLAAFLGALGTSLCIWAIAARSGAGRVTVTLVGVAVSSILGAAINTVKTLFPDSVYDVTGFMIGGFAGVGYDKLIGAGAVILSGLLLATVFSRGLDLLSLGEETARGLGVNVMHSRFLFLMLASALAGAAVSFAGLLGFVGLLVPHIMRRFVGSSHRYLVPASAMGGAILVLFCDLLSRVLFAPYELPVGILLSLIGGPFFVALVLTKRRG
ncbi:MAG: iron ABC transporter permease [Clostridia bacterium]|nr:iron ABC transporter permease [Clostridia bacterium]